MKIRKILILSLLLAPLLSFSQKDSTLRFPSSKSFMIELDFTPFGNDGVFSFNELKTKYWINNKTAFRIGIELNRKKNSTSEDDYETTATDKSTYTEKSFMFGIKPGFEFRILKQTKVSPYLGFEILFRNQSSDAEYEDYGSGYWPNQIEITTTEVSGGWREQEYTNNGGYYYSNTTFSKNRAFYSFGGNFLLGVDFNLIKNVYFGFEIGLGYERIKFKQIEIDRTGSIDKTTLPSSKSSNLGFNYNSSIRLGVWF